MPNVDVLREEIFKRLGRTFTKKEFEELCFNFGIELDGVTSEFKKVSKEISEEEAIKRDASKEVIYTIDIPANRYDLLGLEGLSQGLNIFLGNCKPHKFTRTKPKHRMRVTTNPGKDELRPHVVCAVLRGMKMDQKIYDRLIELQEKLHFNICRQRKFVAIGTHDLDKIQPDFLYDARSPKDIKFQALKQDKTMTAEGLFKHYRQLGKAQCSVLKYCPIIEDSPLYPVIYDKRGEVLSLPPIINSEYSKISVDTKNIFIECTATDLNKANIVLHTIVAGFSEYCETPYQVEGVEVIYDNGESYITPTMEEQEFKCTREYINKKLGTDFSAKKIAELLSKMALQTQIKGSDLIVKAPITRSDLMHPVDVVEDTAIAFGFNNLKRPYPQDMTFGAQQPLNMLSDQIREHVAQCGFTEVLTFVLMSKKQSYSKCNLQDKGYAVELSASKTKISEMCRVNLLPGMLETLSKNQGVVSLPIQIFELGDVVLMDKDTDVGARNERRLCAAVCTNKAGGLELVHGLLERVMQINQVYFLHDESAPEGKRKYSLGKGQCPTFLPGLQAEVLMQDEGGKWVQVGQFGIVAPAVLKKFGVMLQAMVYALEINVEVFV